MNDAGVVASLVLGNFGLFFEQNQTTPGMFLEQFISGGQSDDATTDDQDITFGTQRSKFLLFWGGRQLESDFRND